MNNAHLVASSKTGASPVNASAPSCHNCQETPGASDTPSFASLLEAETNKGAPVSNQPQIEQVEQDPATLLVDLSSLTQDNLPASTLLPQTAKDNEIKGQQTATDLLASREAKPDPNITDLTAAPTNPEERRTSLANFADHLHVVGGQPDANHPGQGQAGKAGNQITDQQSALPPTSPAQDKPFPVKTDLVDAANPNLAKNTNANQPDARLQAGAMPGQEPASTPATTTGLLNGAGLTPETDRALNLAQAQAALSRKSPAVLNDNLPATSDGQPVAKSDTTEQGSTSPLQARTSDNNKAAKAYGLETPLKTMPGDPSPSAKAGLTGADTRAASETTSTSGDRPPSPAPAASSGTEPAAPKNAKARPASLMQRLKPLAQAAFSLQDTDKNAKTSDALSSAFSMTAGGDIARPAGITGPTPTTNNAGLPQVPLNNIAVHIASQANAGNHRFNIRLDPPELGRIDIRLEIGRDGQTLTHLAVEKPETLDLLRQDARQLERALSNAGLDSRNGSLSFSLRDENQNRQQAGSPNQDGSPDSDENTIEPEELNEAATTRTVNVNAGLDISI